MRVEAIGRLPLAGKRAAEAADVEDDPASPFSTPMGLRTPRTPEPKKRNAAALAPPPGPAVLRRELRTDMEEALHLRSLPLLSLALARGQQCACSGGGEDHRVHEAVRRQHPGALKLLLGCGAGSVDDRCLGRRPLQVAVRSSAIAGDSGYVLATLLLQHGASPNHVPGDDPATDAPLHDAARRGNSAAVALLLASGASACGLDALGRAPLHALCRAPLPLELAHGGPGDATKVLDLLLRARASPVQLDAEGRTPIKVLMESEAAAPPLCGLASLGLGPSGANRLRTALAAAEHRWTRAALLATRCSVLGQRQGACLSHSARGADGAGEANQGFLCWELPGLFETVVSFI